MTKRSTDQVEKAATNILLVIFLAIGFAGSWLILDWIGFTWALFGKLALLNFASSLFWYSLRDLVKG